MPSFYEFFCGGGMARAGLGEGWSCLFANDFDRKKGMTYQLNWGAEGEFQVGDVKKIKVNALSGMADLAWASFPCQDLSLAGGGAGLKGERSGTFYPFWDVMNKLIREGRGPKVIALENVVGTLTSHDGKDFAAICKTYHKAGYRFGALVVDAKLFVPQSRPRLFVIGVREDVGIERGLISPEAVLPFHSRSLQRAYLKLPRTVRESWIWWNIPTPCLRSNTFADLIETAPIDVDWHSTDETDALLRKMTPVNIAKVEAAKRAGRRMVGAVYKRTRIEHDGKKVRAEVRFDDIAGCLRTPAGGSSRQTILVVEGDYVRSRLLSAREAARLMGLPDSYRLPKNYNEAYHLVGDGVAVPVVRFLAQQLFEPLLFIERREYGQKNRSDRNKNSTSRNGRVA